MRQIYICVLMWKSGDGYIKNLPCLTIAESKEQADSNAYLNFSGTYPDEEYDDLKINSWECTAMATQMVIGLMNSLPEDNKL